MIVGHLLAGEPSLALAIRQHQPFRALSLTLDGAQTVAGQWQVDGVPRFDAVSGRFVGHIGRMRRRARYRPHRVMATALPCSMNCARRSTRSRALPRSSSSSCLAPPRMNIAPLPPASPPTARMLAGFEELERFARLDSGAMEHSGSSDLAECVASTLARLGLRRRRAA
jgi:hypothetical protein